MKQKNEKLSCLWSMGLVLFGSVLFFLYVHAGYVASDPDKTIYQYIGKVIKEGLIPYRDVFDHKGPIIYFWHWMGALFSVRFGAWVMEYFLLLGTLICAFRMLLRLVSPLIAFISVLSLFSALSFSEAIGNTESLSLLFLIICLNIFCKYILKETLTKKDGIILGLSLSILLLIKPIHLAMPIILGIYAFFVGVKRKDIKTFKSLLLPTLFSFLIIMFLTLGYFIYHDALDDFWEAYIVFNIAYGKKFVNCTCQKEALFYFIKQEIILIPLLGLPFLFLKREADKRKIIFPVFITFIVVFYTIILPGRRYTHYMITLLPLSLILLSLEMSVFKNKWKIIPFLLLLFIFSFNLSDFWAQNVLKISLEYAFASERQFARVIQKEIPPGGTFLDLLSTNARLFLLSDRNSYSKYPYVHVGDVDAGMNMIIEDLDEKGLPNYIAIDSFAIQPKLLLSYNIIYKRGRRLLLKIKD